MKMGAIREKKCSVEWENVREFGDAFQAYRHSSINLCFIQKSEAAQWGKIRYVTMLYLQVWSIFREYEWLFRELLLQNVDVRLKF